jgi:hypothetical protein
MQAGQEAQELPAVLASVPAELAREIRPSDPSGCAERRAEQLAQAISNLSLHAGESGGGAKAMVGLVAALQGARTSLDVEQGRLGEGAHCAQTIEATVQTDRPQAPGDDAERPRIVSGRYDSIEP